MSYYLRCPECSYTLCRYKMFFDLAKQAFYNKEIKYKTYSPDKLIFTNDIIELDFIFNACGIRNRCCRMHLMNVAEFDKSYK